MKLEKDYQSGLIKRLKDAFPKALVLKNDAGYLQGIPDLLILNGPKWALLEIKRSATSPDRPNQAYYVVWSKEIGAFGARIFPENESEIVRLLRNHFDGPAQ